MKRTWLIVPILALAGCGQGPLHSMNYYKTHKSAMQKELDSASCKSEIEHLRNDPSALRRLEKTYNQKTKSFPDHRINNCLMAHKENSDEQLAAAMHSMFGGWNNNVMP